MSAPRTETSSMAFTLRAQVRHPLVLLSQKQTIDAANFT